jgi:hypothetical protein
MAQFILILFLSSVLKHPTLFVPSLNKNTSQAIKLEGVFYALFLLYFFLKRHRSYFYLTSVSSFSLQVLANASLGCGLSTSIWVIFSLGNTIQHCLNGYTIAFLLCPKNVYTQHIMVCTVSLPHIAP